jgi:hypothetical protein
MSFVIVPDYLAEKIYRLVDEEIAKYPPAAPDRELIYSQILGYFNEHGVIPDFSLKANPQGEPK